MLLAASVLLSCAQLEESRCERLAAVVSHAQSQSALLPRSALPFSLVSHPAEARSLLSAHDAFVFDCDGVLWSGSLGLLPGVADLLEHLERLGKRSIFVTNNSAKSRAQYAEKFRALGLRVDPEQIVPASYAAARWLRSARPSLQAAFVIGEQGVDDELRAVGKSRTSLTQVSHKSHKRLTNVSHTSHKRLTHVSHKSHTRLTQVSHSPFVCHGPPILPMSISFVISLLLLFFFCRDRADTPAAFATSFRRVCIRECEG